MVEFFGDAVVALGADGALGLVQGSQGGEGAEGQTLLDGQVGGGEAAVVLGGQEDTNDGVGGWGYSCDLKEVKKIIPTYIFTGVFFFIIPS